MALKLFERDGSGETWWYEYDELGRIVSERSGSPGDPVRIGYNYDAGVQGVGRLREVVDVVGDVTTRFEYEVRGNVTRTERFHNGNQLTDDSVEYNDLKLAKKRGYDNGRELTTEYGLDGLPRSVTFDSAATGAIPLAANIEYHASSRVRSAELAGGAIIYDANYEPFTQRILSRVYMDAANNMLSGCTDVQYDRVGNVVAFTDHSPPQQPLEWTYAYDSLYRLRHAVAKSAGATVADLEYRYDAAGNFTRNDEYRNAEDWLYGSANEVTGTQSAPNSITYSGGGRVASNPEHQQITWNDRKRVSDIQHADGSTATSGYDYEGKLLRLERDDGAGAQRSSWFFSEEHEAHNTEPVYNVMLEGVPWMTVGADGTLRVLARGLADSVVRELDGAGAVVPGSDERFLPFGARLDAAPSQTKTRGFAGAIQGTDSTLCDGCSALSTGIWSISSA